jgi:hypothetical protein
MIVLLKILYILSSLLLGIGHIMEGRRLLKEGWEPKWLSVSAILFGILFSIIPFSVWFI